ncbi:nucleolar and spindle-associated protein 1-like [Glandiceps talaboti]
MTQQVDVMKLEGMKRADLQKLAKQVGIKANMKTVKLIEALKEHFERNISATANVDKETPVKKMLTPKVGTPKAAEKKAVTPKSADEEKITSEISSGKKVKKIKRSTYEVAPEVKVPSPKPKTPVEPPTQKRKRSRSKKNSPAPVEDGSNSRQEPPAKKRKRSNQTSSGEDGVTKRKSSPRLAAKQTSPIVETVAAQSDPDMKAAIMADINKRVEERRSQMQSTGKIPRFAAFAARSQEKKAVTPGNKDWKKIHKKAFDDMEGIDAYLERKRKRMEALSASAKKAKTYANEAKSAAETLKALKTPQSVAKHVRIAKPVVKIVTPNTGLKSPKPFVPSVTSVDKINTNFRKSVLKTPSKPVLPPLMTKYKGSTPANPTTRKSVGASTLPQSQRRRSAVSNVDSRKSLGTDQRKSVGSGLAPITPNPKKMFDLKASLGKPLSYKPHTGKLKPLGENAIYNKFNKTVSLTKVKEEIKKPKLQSRDSRRQANHQHRKSKRTSNMMAKRGIKA